MKRLLKLLARLYPRSWRRRYGAEFDALLDDSTPVARDAFDVFRGGLKMHARTWTFGRITFTGALAGILVGAAIFFTLPAHYVSQVTVTIKPFDDTTGAVPANVQRDALSAESLMPIILKNNLYARERTRVPMDEVVSQMRRDISLVPLTDGRSKNGDAFSFILQFDYSDPRLAQMVNSELVFRFMQTVLKERLAQPSVNPGATFRVLDPPTLPRVPTGPTRAQFIAIGLFAGLLAGCSFAAVRRSRGTQALG